MMPSAIDPDHALLARLCHEAIDNLGRNASSTAIARAVRRCCRRRWKDDASLGLAIRLGVNAARMRRAGL
jgi:hypothetical protein